jgi:hypothetical protein
MEMGTSIEFDNVFQNEEHLFAYLVNRVFSDFNITGEIEDIDYESDYLDRVFITMSDGKEHIIRTWNIIDNDDTVLVDYTLFQD